MADEETTLTDDQIQTSRAQGGTASGAPMTGGAPQDTDGTDAMDADGTDAMDADGTDAQDADGTDVADSRE
jgi:large repetitive protein